MTQLSQTSRAVDDIRTFFDTTQSDPAAIRAVLPAAIRLPRKPGDAVGS
jgi:hypothetical protein